MTLISPPKQIRPERPLTPEDLDGDLIQPGHPLFGIIWVNPGRMSGAPCFSGTRVPIQHLFDYLSDEPLSEFMEDFPGVTQEQAEAVIRLAGEKLLNGLPHS
jgi:uncharacterized protein (DUF433 family)